MIIVVAVLMFIIIGCKQKPDFMKDLAKEYNCSKMTEIQRDIANKHMKNKLIGKKVKFTRSGVTSVEATRWPNKNKGKYRISYVYDRDLALPSADIFTNNENAIKINKGDSITCEGTVADAWCHDIFNSVEIYPAKLLQINGEDVQGVSGQK